MKDDELVLGCRGSSGAGGVAFVTSVGLMMVVWAGEVEEEVGCPVQHIYGWPCTLQFLARGSAPSWMQLLIADSAADVTNCGAYLAASLIRDANSAVCLGDHVYLRLTAECGIQWNPFQGTSFNRHEADRLEPCLQLHQNLFLKQHNFIFDITVEPLWDPTN